MHKEVQESDAGAYSETREKEGGTKAVAVSTSVLCSLIATRQMQEADCAEMATLDSILAEAVTRTADCDENAEPDSVLEAADDNTAD